MKAQDIFYLAVTLMFGEEADRVDYKPFYINILNILLAETFFANQTLRKQRGKEEMTEIPYIQNMEEEVDYEPEFTRQILPYGIAGYIYTDDDKNMGSEYKNKYEYEKNKILCCTYEDVNNVYQ